MKKPISATIEKELLDWIDSKLAEGSRYRNKSHIIETALEMMKQEESKKKR
ncbi:MAG TPA: type II toxin-antitoxin system ParD family antitoxin [Candidatus Nanoarchaeia archaeon]|nr:type II toxin-antitoxin system ParD family antitoxin [Candidatus Nanoarchaeia archaeon]